MRRTAAADSVCRRGVKDVELTGIHRACLRVG